MNRPSAQIRATIAVLASVLFAAGAAHAAAPVANDDYAVATDRYLQAVNGVETYSMLIDVFANDEDADGDKLDVVITGDFGLPPAIWTPKPDGVGTNRYLGAGLFELTFAKDALGDATEVTFEYELEGASSLATVHVSVANEGPPGQVEARPDTFDDPWACYLTMPVLDNDTGLDTVVSFTQPINGQGEVRRDLVDPNVLIYRGGDGGDFMYTAQSSVTGETAMTTVSVQPGDPIYPKSTMSTAAATSPSTGFGQIKLADCFSRDDGVALNDELVTYYSPGTFVTLPTWTATAISHLEEAATNSSALPMDPGGSGVRRKAYLPFDADTVISGSGTTAVQVQGTFKADADAANWVALAFTHGTGSVLTEGDLWLQLDVTSGELILNGRLSNTTSAELARANPTADGYKFLQNDINHLMLRYDTAPTVPEIDAWINGFRVFSRVPLADVTESIENVGFFINHGQKAADPGDVWFDDFELRVGDVSEARLQPKAGGSGPSAGVDVESGSTVDMGPVHLGCGPAHTNCHPFREMSLWLTNDGNQDLEVSNLSFVGPTAWTLDGPTGDSFSIRPGENAEIVVRVDALELGTTTSRLELATNDADLGKLVVHFTTDVTQAPIADFVDSCDGPDCTFDGGGSTGEGLVTLSYVWTVDGQTLLGGPARDYTFTTSGAHTVELQVTDATEAAHSIVRTINVLPEASFTVTCANASRVCDFDAGTSTAGVVSYRWYFGDGTPLDGTGSPNGDVIRHTYATSGTYAVSLKLTDADNQESTVIHQVELTPVPGFDATCSPETRTCDFDASGSTPGMVAYSWQLGDGQVTAGASASHVYAASGIYQVTLTVVDSAGHLEAVSKPVPLPPVSVFTAQCKPTFFSCSFDSTGSTPGASLSWSFGDGSPAGSGSTASHAYGKSGVFTVTLTVTDGSNQSVSSSQVVTFPPSAVFSVWCDSLTCRFDASASSPGVSSYAWSFGDGGAAGSGVDPVHGYPDAGDYSVSLTVTDASGQTATDTQTLSVVDENLLLLILLDRR